MEGFLIIYFGIGLIYALYVWLFGADKWYWLLVNVIGGPVVIIYLVVKTLFRKKVP